MHHDHDEYLFSFFFFFTFKWMVPHPYPKIFTSTPENTHHTWSTACAISSRRLSSPPPHTRPGCTWDRKPSLVAWTAYFYMKQKMKRISNKRYTKHNKNTPTKSIVQNKYWTFSGSINRRLHPHGTMMKAVSNAWNQHIFSKNILFSEYQSELYHIIYVYKL